MEQGSSALRGCRDSETWPGKVLGGGCVCSNQLSALLRSSGFYMEQGTSEAVSGIVSAAVFQNRQVEVGAAASRGPLPLQSPFS